MPDTFRNDESYDKQSVDAPAHTKPYPVGMSRRTANRNRVWNLQPMNPPVQPTVLLTDDGAYKLVLGDKELQRVFNRVGAIAEFAALSGMNVHDVEELFRKAEEAFVKETKPLGKWEEHGGERIWVYPKESTPDVESYIYTVEHTRHFVVKGVKPKMLAEMELLYSIPEDATWEIGRSALYTNAWTVNVHWVEKFNTLPMRKPTTDWD
jgi:hypothetical protein